MSSPSLVGGAALRAYDFPASIVFAISYSILFHVFFYRMLYRRSRTIMIVQPLGFSIERQVMYTLRAIAAWQSTESPHLTKYMQITFALGYLAVADTLSKIIRAVLVNSTNGTPNLDSDQSNHPLVQSHSSRDDPRRRFWYRRWQDALAMINLVAIVCAVIAEIQVYASIDTADNHRVQLLRYASSAAGLLQIFAEVLMLLWALGYAPRVDQRAVRLLLVMTTLLVKRLFNAQSIFKTLTPSRKMIPPIYRLVVMHNTTPDVAAKDHQSLNTAGDKAAFYVVHLVPEYIVVVMLCVYNVKEVFQTGNWGDLRWRDETPKEREKRERKKARAKNSSFELSNMN
ncbi:hypothetical protein DFH06DRAFT_1282296 [Mycena polygramma]|nr:hypothetical protein DFH06DRAFT_1282296 [Mycena polygramma]